MRNRNFLNLPSFATARTLSGVIFHGVSATVRSCFNRTSHRSLIKREPNRWRKLLSLITSGPLSSRDKYSRQIRDSRVTVKNKISENGMSGITI